MTQKERNVFGGGNANSAYVPMTDVEQETLARLVSTGDIVLVTSAGSPTVQQVIYGDLRVAVKFRLDFHSPPAPGKPLLFLDLSLQTQAGQVLLRKREATEVNGLPITVGEGTFFDMVWDIAIHHMSPALVKAIVPGALGLTSRRMDRDTGDVTLVGNMRDLTPDKVSLLKAMANGEASLKKGDAAKLAKLAKLAKK